MPLPQLSQLRSHEVFQAAPLSQKEMALNNYFDKAKGEAPEGNQENVDVARGIALTRERWSHFKDHGLAPEKEFATKALEAQRNFLTETRRLSSANLPDGERAIELKKLQNSFGRTIMEASNALEKQEKDAINSAAKFASWREEVVDVIQTYGTDEDLRAFRKGMRPLENRDVEPAKTRLPSIPDMGRVAATMRKKLDEINTRYKAAGLDLSDYSSKVQDFRVASQQFSEPAVTDSQGRIAVNERMLAKDPQVVESYIKDMEAPRAEKERWLDYAADDGAQISRARQAIGERYAKIFNKSDILKRKAGVEEFDAQSAFTLIQGQELQQLADENEGVATKIKEGLLFPIFGAAAVGMSMEESTKSSMTSGSLETVRFLSRVGSGILGPFSKPFYDPITEWTEEERQAIDALKGASGIGASGMSQLTDTMARVLPTLVVPLGSGRLASLAGGPKAGQAVAVGMGAAQAGEAEFANSGSLAAALTQFGVTALTAGIFSKLNRGGFEEAVASIRGTTAHTTLMGSLKRIRKGMTDEFYEELIDEYTANLLISKQLNQDYSDMENAKQALFAGLVGGLMGGGMTTINEVSMPSPEKFSHEGMRLNQISNDLQQAGLNQTASQVADLARRETQKGQLDQPPVGEDVLSALERVRDNEATPEDVEGLQSAGMLEVFEGENVITQSGIQALEKAEKPLPAKSESERRAEIAFREAPEEQGELLGSFPTEQGAMDYAESQGLTGEDVEIISNNEVVEVRRKASEQSAPAPDTGQATTEVEAETPSAVPKPPVEASQEGDAVSTPEAARDDSGGTLKAPSQEEIDAQKSQVRDLRSQENLLQRLRDCLNG